MLNPYCFTIENGVYEDSLNTATSFLIFASTEQKAINFCNEYVKKKVEEDKYVNDDGKTVNQWWSYYKITRNELREFHNEAVNIRILD
jgi:hypothetical protein